MRLVPEEFLDRVKDLIQAYIDSVLVLDVIEDVCSKTHNNIQRLIQEVPFQSELQLGYVFSGDAFMIQLEQLLSDDLRVNVMEPDREKHLAVTMELFQHLCVAVLQGFEQLL